MLVKSMETVMWVLFALKIANVGDFSWWIPIGMLIAYITINFIVEYGNRDKTGEDWFDGMFD